jgi:hypothetical protein
VWRYIATILDPQDNMDMAGQLHVPAALRPEKGLQSTIKTEAGWIPEPVWVLGIREIILGLG